MVDNPADSHTLKHLWIEARRVSGDYGPPRRDMSGVSSGRNRAEHGARLVKDLSDAISTARERLALQREDVVAGRAGFYLEVEGEQGSKLPNLSWVRQHIRMGATRLTEAGAEVGAVFVPLASAEFLASQVREYAEENTPNNEPKHKAKIEPVETFRAGDVASLWTDQRPLPDADDPLWWECWAWKDRLQNLMTAVARLDLRASERRLAFPEFHVVPVFATRPEIERLLQNCDAIEELRRATDTPHFFTHTVRKEQTLWVDDLVGRLTAPDLNGPAVCLLDGGIAHAHPLIAPAMTVDDCYTVDPDWGVDDHDPQGHGTGMGGTALYGDLTASLASADPVHLPCVLESVKFLPPPGVDPNDPQNYGAITQAAVAIPEITKPARQRIYCMAVTNEDVSGERPTSWSAAVDQICAGAMPGDPDDDPPHRLFVVSAGNIPDSSDPDEISDPDEFPVEDPAQAWNVLSVGAFTDKGGIQDDGYDGWTPVAEVGDRSPYSRTSTDWDHSRTPMKPEVVFEGGNRALSPAGTEVVAGLDSLSLLTTNRAFDTLPLNTTWATSPATAQAAGFAAAIMAANANLWPETVRALLVHSARWTPKMTARLKACKGKKRNCIAEARHFGYGVPQLDRALASAQNDIALIAQAEMQPFRRERRADGTWADPTFNEAHYYDLPWPRSALERLGDKPVQLKVVLSYFIEPSPGDVAPVTPARYQSFGLRFDLKRAGETTQDFIRRFNEVERTAGEERPKADADSRWTFGSQSVAAGSLHCDVWDGPAVELAARNVIAVYPVSGWWRYRVPLRRYNRMARYALIVSITSEDTEVELYNEVAAAIATPVELPIG